MVVASPAWAAEAPVGFVYAQRGAVDLERAGQSRRLHLADQLQPGDLIVTETDSRVLIELNDGSTLALGADSRLRLKELLFDRDSGVFNGEITLKRGTLRAALSHRDRPRDFRVATPNAAVSSGGADWIMVAGEAGTSVFVVAGQVQVAGADGEVTVELAPNLGTEVAIRGAPTPPERWGQARIQRVIARTNVP